MLYEFGKSLLRVGIKKAIEQGVREENEGVGMVLGLLNAATEKADTRSWQTLPHGIYYTRVPLKSGENTVKLKASKSSTLSKSQTFTFTGMEGKTIFQSYQTLN